MAQFDAEFTTPYCDGAFSLLNDPTEVSSLSEVALMVSSVMKVLELTNLKLVKLNNTMEMRTSGCERLLMKLCEAQNLSHGTPVGEPFETANPQQPVPQGTTLSGSTDRGVTPSPISHTSEDPITGTPARRPRKKGSSPGTGNHAWPSENTASQSHTRPVIKQPGAGKGVGAPTLGHHGTSRRSSTHVTGTDSSSRHRDKRNQSGADGPPLAAGPPPDSERQSSTASTPPRAHNTPPHTTTLHAPQPHHHAHHHTRQSSPNPSHTGGTPPSQREVPDSTMRSLSDHQSYLDHPPHRTSTSQSTPLDEHHYHPTHTHTDPPPASDKSNGHYSTRHHGGDARHKDAWSDARHHRDREDQGTSHRDSRRRKGSTSRDGSSSRDHGSRDHRDQRDRDRDVEGRVKASSGSTGGYYDHEPPEDVARQQKPTKKKQNSAEYDFLASEHSLSSGTRDALARSYAFTYQEPP